jgi:hypothetical protein
MKQKFIKDDITGDIDASPVPIQALIAFVHSTIAKKDTYLGAKLKLVLIIFAKIRLIDTT